MGILPERPRKGDGPPPLVAYWRGVVRNSRVGKWVAAHKNASAAIAGLLAAFKVWRWLIFDLARIVWHPTGVWRFATHHVVLAAAATLAVFVVVFLLARFGIDWLSSEEAGERAGHADARVAHRR